MMSQFCRLLCGDSRALVPTLEPHSISAIVTDPPYALTSDGHRGRKGFMSATWDVADVAFDPTFWRSLLPVVKPGAHLVAFGGDRTHHRLMCAIEDGGWALRNTLVWLFGSGFPKNATQLKPAAEFIVLARAPFRGSERACVERWGTGALQIDACRIDGAPPSVPQPSFNSPTGRTYGMKTGHGRNGSMSSASGRHPSTLLLSHSPGCVRTGVKRVKGTALQGPNGKDNTGRYGGFSQGHARTTAPQYTDPDGTEEVAAYHCVEGCPVAELDRQSGNRHSGSHVRGTEGSPKTQDIWGTFNGRTAFQGYDDDGGASRFFTCFEPDTGPGFRYEGKAPTSERQHGKHQTQKPLKLMDWIISLICPPNGVVLDPFLGSGTTGLSALAAGHSFIGCDLSAEHIATARRRLGLLAGLEEIR